jgi:hypothetical protein
MSVAVKLQRKPAICVEFEETREIARGYPHAICDEIIALEATITLLAMAASSAT